MLTLERNFHGKSIFSKMLIFFVRESNEMPNCLCHHVALPSWALTALISIIFSHAAMQMGKFTSWWRPLICPFISSLWQFHCLFWLYSRWSIEAVTPRLKVCPFFGRDKENSPHNKIKPLRDSVGICEWGDWGHPILDMFSLRWWNRRACAHILLKELQNCN